MSATSGLTVLHDAHCAAQFVRHNAAARKPWRVRFSAPIGRYEAQPHNRGGCGGLPIRNPLQSYLKRKIT